MCGIIGTINIRHNINNTLQSLRHRGYDSNGAYIFKDVCLMHTRLAIVDLHSGVQPYNYERYCIVFNGEIYNHMELRKNHLKEFVFTNNSDTQTLLFMYIKYQNDMLNMLDGMFAFAILDKQEDKIILCRDKSGKKPLYLYQNPSQDKLMFSSELNTIKNVIKELKIDEDNIKSYIRDGFFFDTSTPYEDITNLKAGYIYEVSLSSKQISKTKYFDILDTYKQEKITNEKYALEKLDEILHKSVKSRLLSSNLEVGAFLSGGIDSSLIVAIASQYTTNLKTFTIKFQNETKNSFDESPLANLTAKRYGTNHTTIPISLNLSNDIENILNQYGEPFMDSSCIPSFYVAKHTKNFVDVALSGDGADELFGGYRRYLPSSHNLLKTAQKLSFLKPILPNPKQKNSIYSYIYRLLALGDKKGLDFYNSSTNDIFEDVLHFKPNKSTKKLDDFIKSTQSQDISSLSKALYLDFEILLKSDFLKKIDISSMANTLEIRSPFLSSYMLDFAPRLSDDLKIKGFTTKYILKQLSKKYLDDELLKQPKRGFEVPLVSWIDNHLKQNIHDTLSSDTYSSNFIDKKFIKNLLDDKIQTTKQKRAKMLWTLYTLEIWHKKEIQI